MTELERALTHIKTRADAWAVKVVKDALSQEPCDDVVSREAFITRYREWMKSEYGKTPDDDTLAIRVIKSLPSATQLSAKDYLDMADRKAKKIKDALTDCGACMKDGRTLDEFIEDSKESEARNDNNINF